MKNMDQWGSGIPRLMMNCQKAGLREPELLEIGGSFRINMFRKTELAKQTDANKFRYSVQGGLDSTQAVILDLKSADKKLLKCTYTCVCLTHYVRENKIIGSFPIRFLKCNKYDTICM